MLSGARPRAAMYGQEFNFWQLGSTTLTPNQHGGVLSVARPRVRSIIFYVQVPNF